MSFCANAYGLGKVAPLQSFPTHKALFETDTGARKLATSHAWLIGASIVPPNWHLLPAGEQTHERRFVSPSGDAWLSLHAQPPTQSIEDHLAAIRRGEHERITYERAGRTWIVVSGYKGDRIFYRKAMLACGGRAWHHLASAQYRSMRAFVLSIPLKECFSNTCVQRASRFA
jgi:hypothetical protein